MVIPDVLPGNHEVILSLRGYNDWDQVVSVGSGQTTAVNAVLLAQVPSTGSLAVISDPAGAEIYIDDDFKGVSPVTISGLSAGTHALSLKLQDYADNTTNITITAGQTGRMPVVLQKVHRLSMMDIILADGVVLMIAVIAGFVMLRKDAKK